MGSATVRKTLASGAQIEQIKGCRGECLRCQSMSFNSCCWCDWSETLRDNGRCPAVTVVAVQRHSGERIYSVDIVPAVRLLEWPRPAWLWRSRWLPDYVTSKIKQPTTDQQPCVVPKIHSTGTSL